MSDAQIKDVDQVTGVTTTGHEWDGIRELNNPLPRWWLWLFYATIVFSVGYMAVYPAVPLVSDATKGLLGWNTRSAVEADLAALEAARGERLAQLRAAPLEAIPADPKLLAFAQAYGKAAFGDNCGGCHGAGGAGAKGYPNLNDDEWIWGGTLADISTTITHGIRSGTDEARVGPMPAFVRDGVVSRADAGALADHVRALAGLPATGTTDPAKGAELFAANCAACHGAEGRGNRELGAPNLTDAIWLYGSDRATLVETIANGRGGVMPAWSGRLDEATIKALTVYVHTLGGGE